MRISAKADYAVRAATALASSNGNGPVNAKDIAVAHDIPLRFLETILADLRNGGIASSRRGFGGGYMLTRPAEQISVADLVRAVEGPVATVAGAEPDAVTLPSGATAVRDVWDALRGVLEGTTLAHLVAGQLPPAIAELAADAQAAAAATRR
jgi:Rrf2 family protein